jgi:hypothetical protein
LVKGGLRKRLALHAFDDFLFYINNLQKLWIGHPSRKHRSSITILQVIRHVKGGFSALAVGHPSRSAGHWSWLPLLWWLGKFRGSKLSTIAPSLCPGGGEIVTDGLHFAKPLQVIRHGVQVIRHDRPVICG